MSDLRYAVRTLARSPGFTLAAVVTLALGIGANTAVFSVVEGVLLRSLPFPGAERLLLILSRSGTSPLRAYETWRTATGAFDDMAAARGEQPVLVAPEGAERVTAWTVTANFFTLLGGRPILGRAFLPEEDRPGSPPVAVLSYAFWQSRFGGDRQVLGHPPLASDGVLPLRSERHPVGGRGRFLGLRATPPRHQLGRSVGGPEPRVTPLAGHQPW